MAATEDGGESDRGNSGDALCRIVICNDASLRSQPVIYNPDFFVEKLRHENTEVFTELVVSNLTRLIDLPGTEFAQLMGEVDPKLPSNNGAASSFFRSLNFLKRKEKGIVFGAPLTEEGIAQIYQLIDYLHKNLRTEGLFRIPGNSNRQQILKDLLNSGMDIDVESGEFHPNDVATLLKMYLGELPEPLLTHRHYNSHLKIANLMLFDAKGNRTGAPDKERQIEALQLLFLLLPSPNRNLLKLLLDLLYQTARKQDRNKMSAHNLALMFAPHIIWPKNLTASDLQEHLIKLNNGVTFMIKHSQKLFKAPPYIREYARLYFSGSRTPASKDDLDLLPAQSSSDYHFQKHPKRSRIGSSPSSSTSVQEQTQQHTEEALKELFRHVHNMPDSAKKKRLIRQFNKNTPHTPVSDAQVTNGKKHVRSRTFSGMIKRKVLGGQITSEKKSRNTTPQSSDGSEYAKENLKYVSLDSPAVYFTRAKLKLSEDLQIRKELTCSGAVELDALGLQFVPSK
uniref:Rho GTPase-activating protein 19 n=1 Tax=Xenopus tropicalis TaxID=8364 RepID=A0A6I8SWW3_XENTR|eukprot:XP_017951347.1 PREDICTED: rho GTPase-activating protein 19 isoform X2 [Xenopus tropicalis]